MTLSIHRLVSGHDAQGKSIFIVDDNVTVSPNRTAAGTSVVELWNTDSTPADNSGSKDPTDHPHRIPPPVNGSVFRVVEYPPDKERFANMAGRDWNAEAKAHGYTRDPGNARHAGFQVLKAADIPSVLVEMGFMSNARDEAALRKEQHRKLVAEAMKRAVDGWFLATGRISVAGGKPG